MGVARGGRDKSSILARHDRAIFGTVDLEHGIADATEFVDRLVDPAAGVLRGVRRCPGLEDPAAPPRPAESKVPRATTKPPRPVLESAPPGPLT